jgi:hypothetical protein
VTLKYYIIIVVVISIIYKALLRCDFKILYYYRLIKIIGPMAIAQEVIRHAVMWRRSSLIHRRALAAVAVL